MYIAVLAVQRLPSGELQLVEQGSQTGEVLDYVVEMVQFEQSALLSEMAKRGELTAHLVDQVRGVS